MDSSSTKNKVFDFYSADGRDLIRKTTQELLPFDPHGWSVDVVAKLIDQVDVLVRTATASGKTGIIAMLAVVLEKIGSDDTFSPRHYQRWFDRDPAILVICPTKCLEHNIVSSWTTQVLFSLTRLKGNQVDVLENQRDCPQRGRVVSRSDQRDTRRSMGPCKSKQSSTHVPWIAQVGRCSCWAQSGWNIIEIQTTMHCPCVRRSSFGVVLGSTLERSLRSDWSNAKSPAW